MQRQTSQTFQRIRKLSDSLVAAIAPSSSSRHGPEDSFFEYGKKGWHPPTPTATVRRRPSYRNGQRVSKEDIRYPLFRPEDPLDPWSDGLEGASAKPPRPPRPSVEQRPFVLGDPKARAEEQRAYRRANADMTRRPERPREEDLPYGAKGSIPMALAPPYVPPPPAIGSRRAPAAGPGAAASSVPFPQSVSGGVHHQRSGEVRRAHREKPLPEPPKEARTGERREVRRPPSKSDFLNLFMSSGPSRNQRTHQPDAVATRAEAGRTVQPVVAEERAHTSARQPPTRVRRTSSAGDVALPPAQHARAYAGQGDENAPPRSREHRPPDLRPVKSAPLRSKENTARGPPLQQQPPPQQSPAVQPQPVPVSPLARVSKPRPRGVPRDVSPENPQRLPTPRRSREEVRAREQPQLPAAMPSVAAKAHAGLRVQQSAAPRAVQMTAAPEHLQTMSLKAQIVRPARDSDRTHRADAEREREREHERDAQRRRERERERERERKRQRPTHTRAIEVEYYGMSDAFAQEITLALTEPERANPLPLDWRAYVATGPDFGVRPLVTKKSRQMAGGK